MVSKIEGADLFIRSCRICCALNTRVLTLSPAEEIKRRQSRRQYIGIGIDKGWEQAPVYYAFHVNTKDSSWTEIMTPPLTVIA